MSTLLLAACLLATAQDAAPARVVTWPGMQSDGRVQLPNGWKLRPAGRQVALGDFPVNMAEHPTAPVLAILHAGYGDHEVVTIDTGSGRIIARASVPQTYGGLAWSPDGAHLYVSGGFDEVIHRFDHKDGYLSGRVAWSTKAENPVQRRQGAIAGLAVTSDGKMVLAADAFGHRVVALDADTGRFAGDVALPDDSFPYAITIDEPRERVYVSLWGASGVAVIERGSTEVKETWPTGPHPNEMLLGPGGKVLYVANANENTVTVHDLEQRGKAVATIGTAIDPRAPAGCTPNALALTPDGAMLLVANADTNDIAAINVTEPKESTPLGFIPTGWYPTCVRVARDGKTIWIANGKGVSSSPNREGPQPDQGAAPLRQYIGGLFRGALSIVPMPSPARMAAYSKTVYDCSPVRRGDPTAVAGADAAGESPIPRKLGEPSPIKYCVYIIKENRTYDQVFGDMPEGNGEPALCLFPEEVTPNHHALAREFVLLDNFYVESEVSADGHEWTMGAYATDFVERTWPLAYRGDGRVGYPGEGNFAIATPRNGYLWDRAREKGVSYRSYGEFVDNGKTFDDPVTTRVEALQGHFDPRFISFDMNYSDLKRADRFLEELKGFEATGDLPRLIVLRLPNDHTSGTAPGQKTPTAFVAENDLALGRVVEALSKSRFWSSMAIFVVEDDAQNGPDHVDAHRTVALAIGPHVRRGVVDSTHYTTSSMLRTMELILGLEPMSQFDAAATPMFRSFTAQADPRTYTCRPARVDLEAVNPPNAPGAAVSLQFDFTKEDRADDLLLNEVVWKSVKGPDAVMPPPVRAAFVLPNREDGEDHD
jgi:DNA-binding beta-propeller fold protein YncE